MNTANSGPAKPEPTSVVGVVKQPSTASRPVFLAYATGGLNVLASSNQDPTHRFHAFQSVFYLLAALAAHALLSVLDVLSPFRPIFDLAAAGAYGYLLWLAWQGRPATLPVIGAIARKQAAPTPSDTPTVH
jgi:uncharacterized membrane protein